MRIQAIVIILVAAALAEAAPAVALTNHCAPADLRLIASCSTENNLKAMVADPADLAQGRRLTGTFGLLDVSAIDRLRTDRVKALVGTGATDNFQPGAASK